MPTSRDRETLPPDDGFRREERTRPGTPRTGAERQLPAPRDPPPDPDRELILRAMADLKSDLEGQLAASRRASEAPRRRGWEDQLTKVAAAVAVIVGAFAAFKPTGRDPRVDEGYKNLSDAVQKLDEHQRSSDSSVEGLRAWIAGYLASTGVKTVDPPGAPPRAIVELQPAPLQSDDVVRPGAAPAVQVKTPLPLPPASAKPVVLKPLSKE